MVLYTLTSSMFLEERELLDSSRWPGETVADPCLHTSANWNTCMFPSSHFRYAGSKSETLCYKESPLRVVQVFSRQILIDKSDIVGRVDVQAEAMDLVSALDSIGVRGKKLSGMSRTGCVLHSLFMPTLRTSSPTNSETPRCTRWKTPFSYHNGR